MSRVCGIYKITCLANGRYYIGSSCNTTLRIKEHLRVLNQGRHINQHLQRAWNKHGGNWFSVEVVSVCERSQLISFEQSYIDAAPRGMLFNNTLKAGVPPPCPPEGHAKQSKTIRKLVRKGRWPALGKWSRARREKHSLMVKSKIKSGSWHWPGSAAWTPAKRKALSKTIKKWHKNRL